MSTVLVNGNLQLFNGVKMFIVWCEKFVTHTLTWFFKYRFDWFYLFALCSIFRKTFFDIQADLSCSYYF